MKLLVTLLLLTIAVSAQTLPTLPAVNTLTAPGITCTIEVQDPAGGLFAQCVQTSDATLLYTAVVRPSDEGVVLGHGPLMCLYWTDDAGKNRLQCADGLKIVADGIVPQITRKRRWYIFWR